MKRNSINITLAIIIIGVVGALTIKVLESLIGVTYLFIGSVIITAIVGILIVPYLQFKRK